MRTDVRTEVAIRRLMKAAKISRRQAEKATRQAEKATSFLYFRMMLRLTSIKDNVTNDERQILVAAILHNEFQKRADSIAQKR